MNKLNTFIIIIISIRSLLAQCDGFNWHHNINSDDCNQTDINVLKEFISNSGNNLNSDMDIDLNMQIEPLELGWQLWEKGRLIHWICNDVPSPYYAYNYSCNLSGEIPDEIGQLDALIKIHLEYNQLNGNVPQSICDISIVNASSYWFKINHNNLCPPYPDCIKIWNQEQLDSNCN